MNLRRLATAVGSGTSTFLIVGAAVIELVGVDIAAGIVGVFSGFIAALVATASVFGWWGRIGSSLRRVLDAYAAFGLAFVFVWFLRYGHVANLDDVVDVPGQLAIAVVVAIAVYLWSWWRRPGLARETESEGEREPETKTESGAGTEHS
jgi:hypothetical protein